MKQIKIFLHKNHSNLPQDSIWESLKDPIDVIGKIILILIGISPIISVYLISSYLADFNAKVIGFSIFSNISNLGFMIIYSFGFLVSYFLIIFALPMLFGYIFGQNPKLNNWNKIKDDFKSIYRQNIDNNKLRLILICIVLYTLILIDIFRIFPSINYCMIIIVEIIDSLIFYILFLIYDLKEQKWWMFSGFFGIVLYTLILIDIYHIFSSIHFYLIIIFEIIYFLLFYIFIFLIYDLKKQKWWMFSGFYWLFLSCFFSFIFLFLVFLSNESLIKYSFWLSLFNAYVTFLFFFLGTSYAIAKKDKTRKDDRISLKSMLITVIGIFIIADIAWFKIPFSKIVLRFSGIGNQNIIFVLKHDTPGCLKKQLINNKIKPKSNKNACVYPNKQSNPVASKKLCPKPTLQTKKFFLLIQTSNNYYISKINKPIVTPPLNRLNSIIKLPKKYVWKIILQKN